ncbi:MAG: bifunctional UDP-N-acetylglucosamine diphosphorylase/glucosamine-1-phosphate N-acetyltransferase GlmU [Caldisericia bacterium]
MRKGIILAAGIGKRMKSSTPKVLHKIFGLPILFYIIKTIKDCGLENIYVIISDNLELFKKELSELNVNFLIQKVPLGTADAVKCAISEIEDEDLVLILPGDTPLIKKETIIKIFDKFEKENPDALLLTSILNDPSPYGRIIRKDGKICKIKEDKDLDEEEKLINEINSGIYIFSGKVLKKYLPKIENNNAQKEYYLTDIIELINNDGGKIESDFVDFEEMVGINTRKDLSNVFKIMNRRKIDELMDNGVTFFDPDTTYISPFVTAKKDCEFFPGVYIEGEVHFGENCVVGPFVKISALDEVVIVEDNVKIGPFASIRDGTKLMKGSKAKTFVEIKKSTVGENSAVPHLSYIGDATIGKNVNIGAGTITCNFDGKKKNPTIIEDDVFIGSDSILVAKEGGLFIKKGSYTAAGSVITEDVPPYTLAIGRARQINKEGRLKNEKG